MDGIVSLLASNGVRMLAMLGGPAVGGPARGRCAGALQRLRRVCAGVRGPLRRRRHVLGAEPSAAVSAGAAVRDLGRGQLDELLDRSPDPARTHRCCSRSAPPCTPVDPGAQILASIGWENAAPYVSQLYQAGAKGVDRRIGFHPYAPDVPSTIGLVQRSAPRWSPRGSEPADLRHRDWASRRAADSADGRHACGAGVARRRRTRAQRLQRRRASTCTR